MSRRVHQASSASGSSSSGSAPDSGPASTSFHGRAGTVRAKQESSPEHEFPPESATTKQAEAEGDDDDDDERDDGGDDDNEEEEDEEEGDLDIADPAEGSSTFGLAIATRSTGTVAAVDSNSQIAAQSEASPSRTRRSADPSEPPLPKRKRVTRACDECRKKKIKCDGKQPCTHCVVYSYECTYDRPSNRKRNTQPQQQIEQLQRRLERAEAVLRALIPNIDVEDTRWDPLVHHRRNASSSSVSSGGTIHHRAGPPGVLSLSSMQATASPGAAGGSAPEPDLESMISATGQLDFDERGFLDYYGHSSGLSFIRRMRDHVGEITGPEQHTADPSVVPAASQSQSHASLRNIAGVSAIAGTESSASKSPPSGMESPFEASLQSIDDLPPHHRALELCNYALEDACATTQLVHKPTFYSHLERIYSISPEAYQNSDNAFVPLIYVVLAVGCLFDQDLQSDLERGGYGSATGQGYRYFWTARQLLDITDCRDLTSLQAIVFMIIFLQCSAKLSTCYTLVGLALRSALRLGLHREFRSGFNPVELETRKRIFSVLRIMDIQVAAMQGLPLAMSEDDIDQELPTEVEDEEITVRGIELARSYHSTTTAGEASPLPAIAASNANSRLFSIVSKIIHRIYPIKGSPRVPGQTGAGSYSVSLTTIRELEADLENWRRSLPHILRTGSPAPPSITRTQKLLRISFAYAQMMLYRPFLHYVSRQNRPQRPVVNQRAYDCAAACISVSRNIIHITVDMQQKELLVGSYWFTMYTTFFAILNLIFFAVEDPESAARQHVMDDARSGKEALRKLAKGSMAADRCTATLTALFEQLGDLTPPGSSTGLAHVGGFAKSADASADSLDYAMLGMASGGDSIFQHQPGQPQQQQISDAMDTTGNQARGPAPSAPATLVSSSPSATRRSSLDPLTVAESSTSGISESTGSLGLSRASTAPTSMAELSPSYRGVGRGRSASISSTSGGRADRYRRAGQRTGRRRGTGNITRRATDRSTSTSSRQSGMSESNQATPALSLAGVINAGQTHAQTQIGLHDHSQIQFQPQLSQVQVQSEMTVRQQQQSYRMMEQQRQQQAALYQNYPGGDTSSLQDLTSMMFPSTDPFAYPNQPATTMPSMGASSQTAALAGHQHPQQQAEQGSVAAAAAARGVVMGGDFPTMRTPDQQREYMQGIQQQQHQQQPPQQQRQDAPSEHSMDDALLDAQLFEPIPAYMTGSVSTFQQPHQLASASVQPVNFYAESSQQGSLSQGQHQQQMDYDSTQHMFDPRILQQQHHQHQHQLLTLGLGIGGMGSHSLLPLQPEEMELDTDIEMASGGSAYYHQDSSSGSGSGAQQGHGGGDSDPSAAALQQRNTGQRRTSGSRSRVGRARGRGGNSRR